MKTTCNEVLQKALVGKTLVSDGILVFNLKILAVEMDAGYEGEIDITMEKEAKCTVYPNSEIEIR